ncbi:MAG TPA: metallophosphoesterase [Pseudonocardiaceae bacterium]|jgi:Icc-related predicted phosphoesterase
MRVHVVSDVHGNTGALARAGDGADALVVLGDLIDFVDYHDHTGGILGRIFGPEVVRRFAELRSGGGTGETGDLLTFVRGLWAQLDDPAQVIEHEVREQYGRIFASLTAPTYATPGNVDLPHLWPEFAGAGVTICDGTTADVGGRWFGFVGGGLLPDGVLPRRNGPWRPYLRTPAEFADAVDRIRAAPRVDVLASHIPPAVPELCYDVVARHPERGSPQLLQFVRARQPRMALFGHVHAPLARRTRIGRTECVNVGHFQRSETPYVLRW